MPRRSDCRRGPAGHRRPVGLGAKASASTASSPTCLPATLNHNAKLRGQPVDVSPAPETGAANPHTQISFLGVPAARIRDVSVVGAHSGPHPGRLRAYSQGDGASFVPDSRLRRGRAGDGARHDHCRPTSAPGQPIRRHERQAGRFRLSRRHPLFDGERHRRFPTRRRHRPTTRASTRCPASKSRS